MSPIRVLRWNDEPARTHEELLRRGVDAIFDPALRASIGALVEDVRQHGDAAVLRALERFDDCTLTADQLEVGADEFDAAEREIDDDLRDGIRLAIANIRGFNERLVEQREWRFELGPGLVVGERATPIASAAVFVPSGKGSYPSTLMQVGAPATVAGVPELCIIVPPVPGSGGKVDPAVLVTAKQLGITKVLRTNGPAGVAAVAFGTETFPKVRKVLGPGSPPVQLAQIECQRFGCHTQMLLGPSESLIIADASADPRLLAADLLNEAEHGSDSAVVLVTTSGALVDRTLPALAAQLEALPEPRRSFARAAFGNGAAVLVDTMDEAVDIANRYAAEHMQLAVEQPEEVLARIEHAGEVLLGQTTPISLANYMLGVPAALPTGGFARVTGGVTAETFMKKMSFARSSESALARLAPGALALARHEGFPAHAAAISARLDGGDHVGGSQAPPHA